MSNASLTAPDGAPSAASSAWKTITRDVRNGLAILTHHALLIVGAIAIALVATLCFKPELASRLPQWPLAAAGTDNGPDLAAAQAAMSSAEHAGAVATLVQEPAAKAAPSDHQQQQWVTQWLSKRYRVAFDATRMLVGAAYNTANEIKLDPLLILAVMAIESGLNPFAESPVGAQGLMQVMAKVHHDKFENLGGVQAALNPVANIKVGSLILKDYMTRGGSVEAGLKMYVGAAAFDTDYGYGSRVLAEYRRLKDVSAGKKVPTITTARAAPKPRPATSETLPAEAENQADATQKQSQADNSQAGDSQTAAL